MEMEKTRNLSHDWGRDVSDRRDLVATYRTVATRSRHQRASRSHHRDLHERLDLVATGQAVATRSRPPRASRSQTEGGSGAAPLGTTPKIGKQPLKGEGIMLNMLES
ncbi:hypothetical protein Taro_009376 [Colocasia esculenta]|uniref:Uncharacterized protein n=1 Tax=Colocasia esculenta TaxID=4460 RepID=A0A843U3V3_COLES|nr:hypothetical protein [Colocasia esculenta]